MKPENRALVGVATATFVVTFDGAAVQMALPILTHELHATVASVQWAMTSFLVVSTAALLPVGRAGDILGRERIFRFGLALFCVASAACALMPTLWSLVGARAVQGFSSALISATSAPLLVAAFPRARGRALGLGNLAIALGLVLGPPAGALLARAGSWRLIFAVAPVFGGVAWWLIRRRLPRSRRRREPLRIVDGLVSVLGLVALLLGGTYGRRWGWGSPRTLAFLVVGALVLAGFVVTQARERTPLLDLALFHRRTFVSGAASEFLGFTALFTITVALPFFLLLGQRRPLVRAGVLVGVVPVMLSTVAPLAGRLTDRIGSRGLCTAGLAAVAAGCALLAGVDASSGTARMAPALALAGAGLGLFESPNGAGTLGALPEARLAVGTATLNTLRNLGMTVGSAVAATLVDYGMAHATGAEGAALGTRLAMTVGALAAALGAVAAFVRPPRTN